MHPPHDVVAVAGPPLRLGIVVGSTRPGRLGPAVAAWTRRVGAAHLRRAAPGTSLELLDVADFGLPLLDWPAPAVLGMASRARTRRWAEAVEACDGFVFVTPEYNHRLPGALRTTIDFVVDEWKDKVAGVVSYGPHGARAVEHLREVLAELSVVDAPTAVALDLVRDFAGDPLAPTDRHRGALNCMLDEIVRSILTLRELRREAMVT